MDFQKIFASQGLLVNHTKLLKETLLANGDIVFPNFPGLKPSEVFVVTLRHETKTKLFFPRTKINFEWISIIFFFVHCSQRYFLSFKIFKAKLNLEAKKSQSETYRTSSSPSDWDVNWKNFKVSESFDEKITANLENYLVSFDFGFRVK